VVKLRRSDGRFLLSAARNQQQSRASRNCRRLCAALFSRKIPAPTASLCAAWAMLTCAGGWNRVLNKTEVPLFQSMMMKVTKKKTKSLESSESVATSAAPAAPAHRAAPTLAVSAPAKPNLPQPARIRIELVEPAAKQVFVAGSFNGWKPETTPLVAADNGRWKGDLKLGPGRYEYLFVVDGQWRTDPNARESVANPFGGRNSVIQVAP
jgi:hypothetical protein